MIIQVEVVNVIDESKMVRTKLIPSSRWDVGGVEEVIAELCVEDASNVPIVASKPLQEGRGIKMW